MPTRTAAAIHIFLGILLGLGSASAQQECIASSQSNEDIFEVKPEQIFATVFDIVYPGDSSKIISIINEDGTDLYGAAQDGLAGERRYFFKQCGSNLQPPQTPCQDSKWNCRSSTSWCPQPRRLVILWCSIASILLPSTLEV